MEKQSEILDVVNTPYKEGFETNVDSEYSPKGLNEDVIRFISKKKNEPTDDTTDTKPITDTTDQTPPENEDKEPEQTKPTTPQKPDSGSSQVENKLPSFILPVSGALSKKHDSELQVYSTTMNDYRVHLGIDVLAPEGEPVCAVADGTVAQIWEDVRMGQCIAIQHAGDAVSVYKNVSAELPEGIIEGAKVKAGQQIATVGATAMVEIADEPHLHFEVSVGGILEDPLEHFSANRLFPAPLRLKSLNLHNQVHRARR